MNLKSLFTRLESRIYQLEKEQIKKVSSIDSSTSSIHRCEFDFLVDRSLNLDAQEDYAIEFAVVAKRLHGSSCLEKVKQSFYRLLFRKSEFYVYVDNGCCQYSLSQLFNCLHSLEAK